eukprot:gene1205-15571_t
MAAEKMLGRVPSSTPYVSWFEFLLDKTGKLLKEHVASKNADPSPLQLCKTFLQKCSMPSQIAGGQPQMPAENERTKQLRFLALVVASYTHWDLDEIDDRYQNINTITGMFQPEGMDNRLLMDCALYSEDKSEQKAGKKQNELYGYLPHSLHVLNQCLVLERDLEVPFPRLNDSNKKAVSNIGEGSSNAEMDVAEEQDGSALENDAADTDELATDTKATENVYDEVIALKCEHIKMQIFADLGLFHFFQEDYHDAFKHFNQLFEYMQKEKECKAMKSLPDIKGAFLACLMICSKTISDDLLLQGNVSLMLRAERCLSKNFEGLYELLREDNLKKELPLDYRINIESLIVAEQRKDLLFSVCACNAVRCSLAGNLLPSPFLKSLKSVKKEEIVIFIEGGSGTIAKDAMETDDNNIVCISLGGSSLLEAVSDFNPKEDAHFVKREVALCTSPDKLKQLAARLGELCPGKDISKGFQCAPYTELVSEVRDPITKMLLHVYLTKARELAGKQDLGQSLSLLTSALEVLNQYCLQSGSNSQTNRIKNVIHHEMLSAKVQREQNKQDGSVVNVDTLRLCKACYHHREQDPLPKKEIYCHIVSYLLNNKEWQFLIDERGNFEGVADFMELGCQLATVSVGLSKAGDAVCKHASELWNTVITIVCDCVSNKSGQPLMAFERSPQGTRRSPAAVTKNDFIMFLKTLKNSTVLSVVASCLISIMNLLKNNGQVELKALYSHIWPTTLNFDNMDGKCEQILSVLSPLLDKIIKSDPRNIAWLRNKADIYLVEGKHRDAMRQYLEVGAMTSNMFSVPVPFHAWDDQIYQRMIDCCMKQKFYSQAVVLCQFVDPIDYGTVLKSIQENGKTCDLIDTTYDCIWDPTILEFLICILFGSLVNFTFLNFEQDAHSKRGEVEKKQIAVKMISQPEINSCNSPETLKQTSGLKKCKFLRFLAKFYWN